MRPSRTRRRLFAGLLIAALACSVALAVHPVQAQTRAPAADAQADPVAEARTLYEEGQFAQAITLLRDAIQTGRVTGRQAIAARELIARCLVRSGDRVEAKEAFKGLLYLSPSYRPASGSLPPDELEVYQQASKEMTSEQITAGQRIPASLAFRVGTGPGKNKSIGEITVAGGGDAEFDVKTEFGGAVRFPITSKISLEIELQRLRATNEDAFTPPVEIEITALPLSVSGLYPVLLRPRWRVQVFGGLGSLMAATSKIRVPLGSSTFLFVTDQKNGFYGHAGLEGEFLVLPRLSVHGRVLERYAKAKDVYDEQDFLAYGTAQVKGQKIDFSGFCAHVGLRAYVGY